MKYLVTGLFIGLMVGLVITTSALDSNVKQTNILQPRIKKIKTPLNRSQWRIASLFHSSIFPSGISAQNLVKNINFLTRTTLELKLFEPGTLVPVFSSFNAVSSGRIGAAVSSPSFWGKIWCSLEKFRKNYSIWQELRYLQFITGIIAEYIYLQTLKCATISCPINNKIHFKSLDTSDTNDQTRK